MTNKNTYRVFALCNQDLEEYNLGGKSRSHEIHSMDFDFAFIHFSGKLFLITLIKNNVRIFSESYLSGNYPIFDVKPEILNTLLTTTQPEQKEESLFRVGDRVYDYYHEWMTIKEAQSHDGIVLTDANNKEVLFMGESIKRLSFTEYNFITGGWSQERPPQIGSSGWFWDNEIDLKEKEVAYGILESLEDGFFSTKNNSYKHFSTEKPF